MKHIVEQIDQQTIEFRRKLISVNNQLLCSVYMCIRVSTFCLWYFLGLLICVFLYLNSQTHFAVARSVFVESYQQCCFGYVWMMVSLELRPDFVISNAWYFQCENWMGVRERTRDRERNTHQTHAHSHRNNPQIEIAEKSLTHTHNTAYIYQIWYRFVLLFCVVRYEC